MHELWLCKRIFEIVQEQAGEKNATCIKKIVLEVGQLAGVDQEALRFSFQVLAAGTRVEKAVLQIIPIHGEALCEFCQKKVPLLQYYDACPLCGKHSLTVTQGEDLRIKSMVVE